MNERNIEKHKFNRLSTSEARACGQKGGIKSGQVRRQKSLVRDALNRVLNMDLQTDKLPGRS